MSVVRLWVLLCAVPALVLASAGEAFAQYQPPSEKALGEDYHVEVGYAFWKADPSLVIASESLGIIGTDIDLVDDLGITSKRLSRLNLVLRPAQKHKFRFEYLPISYNADSVVARAFIFNGQRYNVGLPVMTTAELKTYRFGYEYDFVSRNRGFAGVLLDVKYTDVKVQLDSPIGSEFTSVGAPIPTIGLVGRGYVSKNVAIGGEVSFFKIPESLNQDYKGRYTDLDIYGIVNFNKNLAATAGYKSIDVFYNVQNDRGTLKFTGLYFGGIARF